MIESIFRLFSLGFIGNAADSIGTDKMIKEKAVDITTKMTTAAQE